MRDARRTPSACTRCLAVLTSTKRSGPCGCATGANSIRRCATPSSGLSRRATFLRACGSFCVSPPSAQGPSASCSKSDARAAPRLRAPWACPRRRRRPCTRWTSIGTAAAIRRAAGVRPFRLRPDHRPGASRRNFLGRGGPERAPMARQRAEVVRSRRWSRNALPAVSISTCGPRSRPRPQRDRAGRGRTRRARHRRHQRAARPNRDRVRLGHRRQVEFYVRAFRPRVVDRPREEIANGWDSPRWSRPVAPRRAAARHRQARRTKRHSRQARQAHHRRMGHRQAAPRAHAQRVAAGADLRGVGGRRREPSRADRWAGLLPGPDRGPADADRARARGGRRRRRLDECAALSRGDADRRGRRG